MTKRQISSIAVILALIICAYFFYQSVPQKEPATPNTDTLLPSAKVDSIEPAIEEPTNNKVITEESSSTSSSIITLPSYKKLLHETYIPREQVLEFVAQNIGKQNNDPTGKINFMLGKAFFHCDSVPKTKTELEEFKRLFESVSLENGDNNGETQASIKRAEDVYAICQTLRETYPDNSTEKFFQTSSRIGNPLAKTVLATFYKPAGFDSWSEEKKSAYRFDMGKNLIEARNQCEPKAFEAIYRAENFGYGNDWKTEEPIDESVKLAHLFAYNLIMSRKYSDGTQINPATISGVLDTYKIDSALVQAEKIYNDFCTN